MYKELELNLADGTSEKAALAVYSAKGRPSNNPLIIHVSDPSEAEKYCFTNEIYKKLADAFMPGPLTVILKKKDVIPFVFQSCPCRAIIAFCGVESIPNKSSCSALSCVSAAMSRPRTACSLFAP